MEEEEEEDTISDEIEEVPKKPRKSKKKTNIRSTITDIKFIKTDKEKKVKVRNVLNQYVEVDPKYYRPAEVETLLGDPTKAKEVLGWNPSETSFEQLVKIMVKHDLELAKKESTIKKAHD